MNPKIFLLLAMLASHAFAEDNALAMVRQYRPAAVPRGSVVEAALFADWFMSQGDKNWAYPVIVTTELNGERCSHGLALFQLNGKLFYWDSDYGVTPMETAPQKLREAGSLAAAAERKYNRMVRDLAGEAIRTGHLPDKIPTSAAETTLEATGERLNETRPVFALAVKVDGQVFNALAFIYLKRLFLYSPELGASAREFGDSPDACLSRMVQEAYGPAATHRILVAKTPRTAG